MDHQKINFVNNQFEEKDKIYIEYFVALDLN